jgi:DNA-binding NarL/FixJ family response regulator
VNTNSASESPIRIYVLEQNRLLREAFVQLLRKRSSLTVVGDSDDCSKAYGELTAIQCDVLLLNSLEILQVIRQKAETAECLKQTKLLLLGMKEDPVTVAIRQYTGNFQSGIGRQIRWRA